MNSIQIIITKPKSSLPSTVFDANGYVTFDITRGFEMSETQSIDKLNIFNNFTDNYVIASSLPSTPKNLLIFEQYKNEEIPIIAMNGGDVLPYRKLQLVRHIENNNPIFEIQFISENPLKDLKEQKISDLDFGSFNYDTSTILTHFENDDNDLNVPYYHPICNYGAWSDTNTVAKAVKITDLRVWFREYSILKKAFQKINWTFESKIHETGAYKKVGNYLLDSFKSETLLKKFGFLAGIETDVAYTGAGVTTITPVFHDDRLIQRTYNTTTGVLNIKYDAYDKGVNTNGYWNKTTQVISGLSGTYKLKFSFFLNTALGGNLGKIRIRIDKNGSQILDFYDCKSSYIGYENTTHVTDSFECLPSDSITISFAAVTTTPTVSAPFDFTLGAGSFIELQPQEVKIQAGLLEGLNKYIKDEYKSIDFLKGVAHCFNAQLQIDYINRKVTMYPPYTVDEIEGYYKDEQIDISQYQIKRGNVYVYPNNESSRYYVLRYKESSDPYIGDVNLFEKRFDFGVKFKDDEFVNENPFFEATATNNNHLLSTIKFPIAVLWDNDDNKLSVNLKPRRCIFESRIPSGADGATNFWKFETTDIATYFPCCYMRAATSYAGQTILENLTYGDLILQGWADKAYYTELLSSYNSGSFESLFILTPIQYDLIDFRKKYIFLYENYIKAGRLIEVQDYKHTSFISTPLKFKI